MGQVPQAVALAQEPDELAVLDHGQASDPLVDHDVDRGAERDRGRHREDGRRHHGPNRNAREPLALGLVLELQERGHGGPEEIALGDDAHHALARDDRQVSDAAEAHDAVGQVEAVRSVEGHDLAPHHVAHFHAGLQFKFRAAARTSARRAPFPPLGNQEGRSSRCQVANRLPSRSDQA